MKKEIIGYITGMIDRNIRRIKIVEELNGNKGELRKYENFKNELSDLLDFVVDIPEEPGVPITVNFNSNNEEIAELKKVVDVLETVAGHGSSERAELEKRIRELESNNRMWQKACNELKEKNEFLEGKINE